MSVRVFPIPARETNYIWAIRDDHTRQTLVVDPSDAEPVQFFLKTQGWQLDCILNTHHHNDHIGGNLELKAQFGCPIYGFEQDAYRIPGITHKLKENDFFNWQGLEARVLFYPGHTLGQIAYYFKNEKMLFSGDLIFALGCGKLFEGTAEQMWNSLNRLKELPSDTQIYCGHEYTQRNSAFAEIYMGDQPEFQLRQQKPPSIPLLLEQELATNPFLNAKDLKEFTEMRRRKDLFNA